MRNKELYKAVFSKLHASEDLNLEICRKRAGVFHRPALAALTALCIFVMGTAAVLAMTGESPVRFFRSFFKNAEGLLSEELSSAYVVASGQSLTYDNMNISLEGYCYTGDALLAKVKITPAEGQQEDIRGNMRRLRFAVSKLSVSVALDWETGVNGEDIAVIRTTLEPAPQMHQEGMQQEGTVTELIVWNQEQGIHNPIGSFPIDMLSQPLTLVPKVLREADWKRIEISGINVRIYFATSVTSEESCPLHELAVIMKDGTRYELYSKESGDRSEIIASEQTFRWSEGADGFLDIAFLEILKPEDMRSLMINGEETQLH